MAPPLRATVAALSAVASMSAGTVAFATSASADRQVATTAIGIEVSPHSISPGESASIRGRLHLASNARDPRPLPDQQVTLKQQSANAADWQAVATATTNDRGVVHFTVAPTGTSHYAIVFTGTDRLGASRSRAVTVWVGRPTNLSITTSAASIDPGETVSVHGLLTEDGQPFAGQTVELRARPEHQREDFATVASGTTASDGSVSFAPSPAVDTVYRLVFRHTTTAATAVSPRAAVEVRRPTSLSIRAVGDTIRGSLLSERNKPLRGQLVALQSSAAGAGSWADVETARTGDHGGVSFAVHPAGPTDYRLSFVETSRFESCQSGIVTISS